MVPMLGLRDARCRLRLLQTYRWREDPILVGFEHLHPDERTHSLGTSCSGATHYVPNLADEPLAQVFTPS